MNIYQNTGVSRPSFFIPFKPMRRSSRIETHGKTGIIVEKWDGDWKVREGSYYNISLKEFPLVGQIDLKKVIVHEVLQAVTNGAKEE